MEKVLLRELVGLATFAGRRIMQIYNAADMAEAAHKADGSPLTAADEASQQVIASGLEKLTPGWPILSEESCAAEYEVRRGWKRYWLVDPLDGTKEFLKRNGEFTVNIALIEEGIPVLGVVHAPALGVTYFATRGEGSFVQRGDEVAMPICCVLPRSGELMRVVASRSHGDERTAALLQSLGEHECVSMGSSLKLCLVAEGKAHLYPRLGPTMEWDTAAAHAVVSEAGGIVVDSEGRTLRYNKPDLHNPEFFVCHERYRGTLADLLAGAG